MHTVKSEQALGFIGICTSLTFAAYSMYQLYLLLK